MTGAPAGTATLRRDGLLAGGALVALLVVGTLIGDGQFLDPRAVVLGVCGALAIEAAFLRYPERLLGLWARPAVALAGVGAVACLALVALWIVPWLLGALTWGLVVYVVLLACVGLGFGNPLAALPGLGDRE